jgi:hypothetical protein
MKNDRDRKGGTNIQTKKDEERQRQKMMNKHRRRKSDTKKGEQTYGQT